MQGKNGKIKPIFLNDYNGAFFAYFFRTRLNFNFNQNIYTKQKLMFNISA